MVWIRQLMPNGVLKEMNKLDFITDLCIIWNTVKIVSLSKFQITKHFGMLIVTKIPKSAELFKG